MVGLGFKTKYPSLPARKSELYLVKGVCYVALMCFPLLHSFRVYDDECALEAIKCHWVVIATNPARIHFGGLLLPDNPKPVRVVSDFSHFFATVVFLGRTSQQLL